MRECPQAEHTGDTACRGGGERAPKKECYFIILRTFQLNTQAFYSGLPPLLPPFFSKARTQFDSPLMAARQGNIPQGLKAFTRQ